MPPSPSDRILSGELEGAEASIEQTLRPRQLTEYVGQDRIVENLKVFIRAARERGEPLDHVLLFGPPGLGKTTLTSCWRMKWIHRPALSWARSSSAPRASQRSLSIGRRAKSSRVSRRPLQKVASFER